MEVSIIIEDEVYKLNKPVISEEYVQGRVQQHVPPQDPTAVIINAVDEGPMTMTEYATDGIESFIKLQR